jgi:hypothetical protein
MSGRADRGQLAFLIGLCLQLTAILVFVAACALCTVSLETNWNPIPSIGGPSYLLERFVEPLLWPAALVACAGMVLAIVGSD